MTEPIIQQEAPPTAENNTEPTQTQAEETKDNSQGKSTDSGENNSDDWKKKYENYSSLKPFLESSKTPEEFNEKLAGGYDNLSGKLGKKDKDEKLDEKRVPPAIETIEGYELGEGEEWFGDVALGQNLTKEQVDAVKEGYTNHVNSIVEQQNKEFDDTLKAEWGDDYEKNIESAKSFLADNLGDEDIKILNGLDNSALLVLAKVALPIQKKYYTNSSVPASGSGGGEITLEGINARIAEIRSSDAFYSPTMSQMAEHEKLIKEEIELRKQANKINNRGN